MSILIYEVFYLCLYQPKKATCNIQVAQGRITMDYLWLYLVTVIATLTVYVITAIFNNKRNAALRLRRLELIYEPLYKELLKPAITNSELSKRITEISREYPSLTPQSLKIYEDNDFKDNTKYVHHYDDIYRHISSNYNWLQKKMGRDYTKDDIVFQYLMFFNKKQTKWRYIKFFVNGIIFASLIVLLIIPDSNPKSGIHATILVFCSGWLWANLFANLLKKWNL